jgi:vancomycin resistance protein YoaR
VPTTGAGPRAAAPGAGGPDPGDPYPGDPDPGDPDPGGPDPGGPIPSATALGTPAGVDDHHPGSPHARRRGRIWLTIVATVVLLATIGVVASAALWGATQRSEARLLPGATIEGVAVGGLTVNGARTAVEQRLADRLAREVTVTHEDRSWQVTPRRLAATTDLDRALAVAAERTADASLVELVRVRFGGELDVSEDVGLHVPEDALDAFVAELAAEVDAEPVAAELAWVDGDTEVAGHVEGRRLDREATREHLEVALLAEGATSEYELPVEALLPERLGETVEAAEALVVEGVAAALDRTLTLELDDRRWETTPRDLDAVPDGEAAVRAALAAVDGDGGSVQREATTQAVAERGPARADGPPEVAVSVEEDAVATFVDAIASEVAVEARNAQVAWSGGLTISEHRTGVALDREHARAGLDELIEGADDRVPLRTETTQPAVTTGAFRDVLVLHQGRREVELHRDGEVLRTWPVAVGTGEQPTPTGQYRVGAKRHMPTWNNPAPGGWGADMPATVGPGPGNPLGVRALNWDRLGGGDTLIRFHGTPDTGSIGRAASNGCVRMYNSDVIEMYDLVGSGTRIISRG